MGSIIDDGFQSGILGQLAGTIVIRGHHNVPASEHALMAGCLNHVQHV
jgi:hypothetical protein